MIAVDDHTTICRSAPRGPLELGLSAARAAPWRQSIMSGGIPADRLIAAGFATRTDRSGASRGPAQNRRIE
jgi:flagellar motor protein MotB